jgi:iron complex transport system substrate-binding protein
MLFLRHVFFLVVILTVPATWTRAQTAVLTPAALRVVSQTVGSDELLLALAEPSQVAALSELADNTNYSAVASQAAAFPRIPANGDAESILRYRPTLVLCADYSRTELVTQLKRAGVPILIFDRYATLDDAFANLRRLARELGPDAEKRAETLIAEGQARIQRLKSALAGVAPKRVIAPSTYGVMAGDQTTFQDLCDHAGAINLGATLGGLHGHSPPPSEKMLTWPIDAVVLDGPDLTAALAVFKKLPPYAYLAAVREGRAVRVESYQLSCVSHHRIDGYEQLARALHPEAFTVAKPLVDALTFPQK